MMRGSRMSLIERHTMGSAASSRLLARLIRWAVGMIILLTALVLAGSRTGWPTWYFATLGLAVLSLVGYSIAKRQGGLLGPHYFYDLIRLARRSRTRDLRMLYGLALLLGLGLIYWVQFPHQDLNSLLFHAGSGM